jgi:hypothetical protein
MSPTAGRLRRRRRALLPRTSPCRDDATPGAGADDWGVTATPEVTAVSPWPLQRGLIVLIGLAPAGAGVLP